MAANLNCLSNRQNSQNLLQPAPSPVGEGWGEGIPRMAATFPSTLTAPIQALRLVALSLTLSHGREDRVAVRIKGFARKTGCAGCFFTFQTTFINAQFRQPVSYYFQNLIKISHLLPCRLLFQFLQHAQDFCQHIVCLLQNFVIPKTQHGKA